MFHLEDKSVFDIKTDAYVNTINCVGAMGAGIALEFKSRYPEMYKEYQSECLLHGIKPGDCWTYKDEKSDVYLLNLAVKRDWKEWATREWIEQSVKSLKLEILEKDIKSVSMPLIGGKNARRGPKGAIEGYSLPPSPEELKRWLTQEMTAFANKFDVDIYLCIPEEKTTENKKDRIKELANSFFNLK